MIRQSEDADVELRDIFPIPGLNIQLEKSSQYFAKKCKWHQFCQTVWNLLGRSDYKRFGVDLVKIKI